MLDSIKTKQEKEIDRKKAISKAVKKANKKKAKKEKLQKDNKLMIERSLIISAILVLLICGLSFVIYFTFMKFVDEGIVVGTVAATIVASIAALVLFICASWAKRKSKGGLVMSLISGFLLSYVMGTFSVWVSYWTKAHDNLFGRWNCFFYYALPIVLITIFAAIIYTICTKSIKLSPFKSLLFAVFISIGIVTLAILIVFLVFMSKNNWALNDLNILLLIILVLTPFGGLGILYAINKFAPKGKLASSRTAAYLMNLTGLIFCIVGAIIGLVGTIMFLVLASRGNTVSVTGTVRVVD